MSDSGRIVQISVSPGGVPKRPVESADVTAGGVAGDLQRDREHHGGPDRGNVSATGPPLRSDIHIQVKTEFAGAIWRAQRRS